MLYLMHLLTLVPFHSYCVHAAHIHALCFRERVNTWGK